MVHTYTHTGSFTLTHIHDGSHLHTYKMVHTYTHTGWFTLTHIFFIESCLLDMLVESKNTITTIATTTYLKMQSHVKQTNKQKTTTI